MSEAGTKYGRYRKHL